MKKSAKGKEYLDIVLPHDTSNFIDHKIAPIVKEVLESINMKLKFGISRHFIGRFDNENVIRIHWEDASDD